MLGARGAAGRFGAVALSLPTREIREENRTRAGKSIIIIYLDQIEAVWQGKMEETASY